MTSNRQVKFYVLRGTLSDLSVFDFVPFNSKISDIKDPDFKKMVVQYTNEKFPNYNWDYFERIIKEIPSTETQYVLYPINIIAEYSQNDLFTCYSLLLLIFPSDLRFKYIIEFQIFEDDKLCNYISYDYGFHSTGEENYYENYVVVYDQFIPEINDFIKLFKIRYEKIPYLKNAFESYVSSFRELTWHQSYLDLCISLESIIEGTNELTYRLKHHISILCAENESRAKIIFNNIGKLYKLRSTIIHGEKYERLKIIEYLPYLRSLVSRMIIELILLNVPAREDLDTILTFGGFSRKPTLTKDYSDMTLNISSYHDLYTKKLK